MVEKPLISGPSSTPPAAVNPTSLSVEQLAQLLSAAGGKRITPEQIQADIAAGAPVGRGERLNLVHYTAWLVREAAHGG